MVGRRCSVAQFQRRSSSSALPADAAPTGFYKDSTPDEAAERRGGGAPQCGMAGRGDPARAGLPGRILPSDYLGPQALVAVRKDRRRVEVLRDASRQLRTFNRAWSSASDGPLVKRLSRCGSVFAHSRNSTSLVL